MITPEKAEIDNHGRHVMRSDGATFYLTQDKRVMREHFSQPDRYGFRTPIRRVVRSSFAEYVRQVIEGSK
jgi:hypothetical protein